MDDFPKKLVAFLGSFELAFILLVLLGLLTFVGTLDQQNLSLFDVQAKYFESWVVWSPVPMFGARTLLSVFFVNMVVGGIIRIRKGRSTIGILISHIGIVVLLFGSFVEDQFKTEGQLTLWAPEKFRDLDGSGAWNAGEPYDDYNQNGRYDGGEVGDEYTSIHRWQVAVVEPTAKGGVREFIIPEKHFNGLSESDSTRYQHADLPFDVVLSGYARNARPRPVRPSEAQRGIGIEGFVIVPRDAVSSSNLRNRPAVVAILQPKDGSKAQAAILWGGSQRPDGVRIPWSVKVGDRSFQVDLRNCVWDLPFSIHVNRFVHKRHPGISMPKEFSSYVTKSTEGRATDVHITMNEPLRHKGYTLYQSGWGPPPERDPNPSRFYTTFSVVANPSDQVPLIACIIIGLGLLIHFIRKLVLHLRAEVRRREALLAQQGGTA